MRAHGLSALFLVTSVASGCGLALGLGDFKDEAGSGGTTSSSSTPTSAASGGSTSTSTPGSTTSESAASATTTGSGGAGGGPVALHDILGVENVSYVALNTVVTKPDLTTAKINILAGPQFDTYPGTGQSNGTFKIPGVPVGEYYLEYLDPGVPVGTPQYYMSSEASIDMSRYVSGRSNIAPITKPTTLTITATGLTSWVMGDSLTLMSPGAGTTADLVKAGGLGNPTAATFTSTFDASLWFDPANIIDSTQKDNTFILQTTPLTTPYPGSLVTKFSSPTVTMVNGQPLPITAAMSNLSLSETASVNWKATTFEAMAPLINPTATVHSEVFSATGVIGSPSDGLSDVTQVLLQFSPPNGTDVLDTMVPYGDPFGTNVYLKEGVETFYNVTLKNTKLTAIFTVHATYFASKATFEGQTVVPIINPVTNVKVDGADAFVSGPLKSTTPTLTFDAAVSASPVQYDVIIFEIMPVMTGITFTQAGEIHAKGTSIQIPPGVIQSGNYVFDIVAQTYPGVPPVDVEATPNRVRIASATAPMLSGIFTTP